MDQNQHTNSQEQDSDQQSDEEADSDQSDECWDLQDILDQKCSIDDAINYVLKVNRWANKKNSCQKTYQYFKRALAQIRNTLVTPGQDQNIQIDADNMPQDLKKELKAATCFGFQLDFQQQASPILFETRRYQKFRQKTFKIVELIEQTRSDDHCVIFIKNKTTQDYYPVHSWQKQFSLRFWLKNKKEFPQLSNWIHDEMKVYPYQNPRDFLHLYLLIVNYCHFQKNFAQDAVKNIARVALIFVIGQQLRHYGVER